MQTYTILFIFVFIFSFSFSQNSYIVKKNGDKIFVKDGSVELISIDKRLSYKLPTGTWEKYIRFKDFDYSWDSGYKIKSFNFEGKRKYKAYYVHVDYDNKILATVTFQTFTQSNNISYRSFHYYIIEGNIKLLKKGSFIDSNKEKRIKKTKEFIEDVETHFGDCKAFMARTENSRKDLPENDSYFAFNGYVFNIFLDPYFIKDCN